MPQTFLRVQPDLLISSLYQPYEYYPGILPFQLHEEEHSNQILAEESIKIHDWSIDHLLWNSACG